MVTRRQGREWALQMLAQFDCKIIASAVYRKIRRLAGSRAYLKTTLALIKPAYLLHIIK